MLGNSLKVGDKAFFFVYSPNNVFHMQEVKIIAALETRKGYIRVITKSEAISTTAIEAKHEVGKKVLFPDNTIKSPEYVRNVLKQYGQRIIKNIFERIF